MSERGSLQPMSRRPLPLRSQLRWHPVGGNAPTPALERQRHRAMLASSGYRNGPMHRIYKTSFASVYPHYVAKAEKKGRTRAEVDEIIRWLTGYSQAELDAQLDQRTDFETFFAGAPAMNPARAAITGVICGIRVEDIEEPLMREIRYLDKLIDELAKGKKMEKVLRHRA
jgi:hypothetical protein